MNQYLSRVKLLKRLSWIEWEDFEVKKAERLIPKNSWQTVSAFANTNGGFLVFGVEEKDENFLITGVQNPEKIQNDFLTTLRGEKFNIPLSAKPTLHNIDGKTILTFYIPEMPRQAKPIYFNNINNTFIRQGGTDQRATKEEIERFLRDASYTASDSMIIKEATWKDLNKETLDRFKNLFLASNQGKIYSTWEIKDLLVKLGLIKNYKNGLQFTAASIMLFGTDNALANYFPHFRIDYLEIPGFKWGGIKDERWSYRILSESNLLESFYKILPRLSIRVPNPFSLKPDNITRDENHPAFIAIREAFVNLLVHMDYFDRKGASIKVYDNRIEFLNGGALLFNEKLLEEGYISEPRNPLVMKIFRILNFAEETGVGIIKMRMHWQEAGFKPPAIETDKRYYFYKISFSFEEKENATPSPRRTRLGLSWDQVGTKLGLSWDQAKKFLALCNKPISISELMESFNWKNRTKFRDKFIKPMIKEELLRLTLPDKPKSPNQQYVITEKGKAFLEELKNFEEEENE